ncbi:MAG: ester cyclase [Thermomicrobiales bacterium]|nr:ester cyclase [Thermomicrobiales bacterium]
MERKATRPAPARAVPPLTGLVATDGATRQVAETLAAELLAAWGAHDLDRVLACYAPDFQGLDIGEAAVTQNFAALRKMTRRWFRAFPDLRLQREGLLVEGNQVALSWTATATHLGAFLRIPATGRPVRIRGISMLTVDAGRIVRGSRIWDMAAFLRDVGLLPELRADNGDETGDT